MVKKEGCMIVHADLKGDMQWIDFSGLKKRWTVDGKKRGLYDSACRLKRLKSRKLVNNIFLAKKSGGWWRNYIFHRIK
jgi:hypothetical protein